MLGTHQADLFAGAIVIEQALGWNVYASIGFLLLIAAIFTITGEQNIIYILCMCALIWKKTIAIFVKFKEGWRYCHQINQKASVKRHN